jgi:hypothetical protein
MGWWDRWRAFYSCGSIEAPSARRLDGRSKALLTASIKMLPFKERGWITSKEARLLFSPMDDQYAFGEMDELGKRNLSTFVSEAIGGCLFEFMPVEERVYFIRKKDAGSDPK